MRFLLLLMIQPLSCFAFGARSEFVTPGEYEVSSIKTCGSAIIGSCDEKPAGEYNRLHIEERSVAGSLAVCLNRFHLAKPNYSVDPTRFECFYNHEVETREPYLLGRTLVKYRKGELQYDKTGFHYNYTVHDQVCSSSGDCRDRDNYREAFELYLEEKTYTFKITASHSIFKVEKEYRMGKVR